MLSGRTNPRLPFLSKRGFYHFLAPLIQHVGHTSDVIFKEMNISVVRNFNGGVSEQLHVHTLGEQRACKRVPQGFVPRLIFATHLFSDTWKREPSPFLRLVFFMKRFLSFLETKWKPFDREKTETKKRVFLRKNKIKKRFLPKTGKNRFFFLGKNSKKVCKCR